MLLVDVTCMEKDNVEVEAKGQQNRKETTCSKQRKYEGRHVVHGNIVDQRATKVYARACGIVLREVKKSTWSTSLSGRRHGTSCKNKGM